MAFRLCLTEQRWKLQCYMWMHSSNKLRDTKPVSARDSTERGTGGQIEKLAARDGRKRRDAYMFLSFDPLVSLLNSLQVLKMQLHQSINLEREWNWDRQREGEGWSTRDGNKKMREIWGGKARAQRRDRTRWDSEGKYEEMFLLFIFCTFIIPWFFYLFAANLLDC